MADIQNASQILNYRGDPGLAFGTSGTTATAAPIGVLDLKHDAFDQVATLEFLKQKGQFDAKKKEWDDTYARLRDVNLSTDKLLDIDKEKIIKDYINPINEFLAKNPNAVNPKTQDQIKQHLQYKKMYNDYLDAKAKGQTRYIYKPLIDQSIASNTFDREDEQKWYDLPLNTALAEIKPYQKHYLLDVAPLKGGEEEIIIGKEGPVLHTETKSKDNFYTTFSATLAKANDVADKGFQKALDDETATYLDTYKLSLQKKQQALAAANNIVDPVQKEEALKAANNIQPFLAQEINNYNNRATVNNKIRPDKVVPLIDPTKPLTREQYLLVKSINKNVTQPLQSYDEKTSGRYSIDMSYAKAKEKLTAKGMSANTYNIGLAALNPFLPQSKDEDEYQKGLNGDKGYSIETKKVNLTEEGYPLDRSGSFIPDNPQSGVYYNDKNNTNVKVVNTPDGRSLARVDGDLIEYDGNTKTWNKVDVPNIPVDDRIIKVVGGSVDKIELVGDKLKFSYTKVQTNAKGEKEGVTKELYMDRNTYLRNIAGSQKEYDDTMDDLRKYGIQNLNNEDNFKKAVELFTTGEIKGMTPDANQKQTYTYKGKSFTAEQVHIMAEKNGVSDEEYIKAAGLK